SCRTAPPGPPGCGGPPRTAGNSPGASCPHPRPVYGQCQYAPAGCRSSTVPGRGGAPRPMTLHVSEAGRQAPFQRGPAQVTRALAQVTRTCDVVPYTSLTAFADAMLGGVRLVGGLLYRTLPARDPELPWCFCESVDVDEGIGAFLNPFPPAGTDVLRHAGFYG